MWSRGTWRLVPDESHPWSASSCLPSPWSTSEASKPHFSIPCRNYHLTNTFFTHMQLVPANIIYKQLVPANTGCCSQVSGRKQRKYLEPKLRRKKDLHLISKLFLSLSERQFAVKYFLDNCLLKWLLLIPKRHPGHLKFTAWQSAWGCARVQAKSSMTVATYLDPFPGLLQTLDGVCRDNQAP